MSVHTLLCAYTIHSSQTGRCIQTLYCHLRVIKGVAEILITNALDPCTGRAAREPRSKFYKTRSSADADNRLDAFSRQSRSTNMVRFHMLHIASYCAIVTLSSTVFVFKKFHDLEMGVKGHSRSLRVLSFDRLCMVSY